MMNRTVLKNSWLTLAIVPLAGLFISGLSGCAGQERYANATPPMVTPQRYTEPEQRYHNPGSLYSAAESIDLYADNRARRVGDIILIKVVETAKSKSKADTTADRETNTSLTVTAAFGKKKSGLIPGLGGPLSGVVGTDPMLGAKSVSGLSATGETKRENYVTATIGARVLNVLPGGVLQVQGAREVRVNEETQYMVVSGLVRLQDVESDNSIASDRMTDSKIEYYGKGVLADKQRPGWLTRLLDNIWPF